MEFRKQTAGSPALNGMSLMRRWATADMGCRKSSAAGTAPLAGRDGMTMLMDPQGCKPLFDGVVLLDAYMLNDVDAHVAGEDDEQVPVSTPNGSAQVGARSWGAGSGLSNRTARCEHARGTP